MRGLQNLRPACAAVLAGLALFCLNGGMTGVARAGGFPEQALSYLIAFKPGGELSMFAQNQIPFLEKRLGQPVRAVYKPGSNGAVGWSELARSAPTGYVIGGINIPQVVLQPLQRKGVGYATTDLKPVMVFMSVPVVLVVPASSPYTSLEAFLQVAKARPGFISLGGRGSGTANHVAAEQLNRLAGVEIPYLPFAGTVDIMPALKGEFVTGAMIFAPLAIQNREELRVLAVATEERLPEFDAPTFREAGFELVQRGYRGVAVPQKTPDTVIKILYDAFAAVNTDPAFVQKVTGLGFRLENMDPKESARFLEEQRTTQKTLLEQSTLEPR